MTQINEDLKRILIKELSAKGKKVTSKMLEKINKSRAIEVILASDTTKLSVFKNNGFKRLATRTKLFKKTVVSTQPYPQYELWKEKVLFMVQM